MQVRPSDNSVEAARPEAEGDAAGARSATKLLFDISGIDRSKLILTAKDLEHFNRHRGHMALLDGIVWQSPDKTQCMGVKHVRDDEFWVAGHFPGRPMYPGVLMVESGAQLANYIYQVRQVRPVLAALLRIEEASFRSMVAPGDSLYILLQEVRYNSKRFTSLLQGLVGDRITFEAKLTGYSLGEVPAL